MAASKDGSSYPIVMVVQNPSTSTVTTNTPAVIIPVIININGTVFNPTVADTTCSSNVKVFNYTRTPG